MGYYINQVDSNFKIMASKKAGALAAIKKLAETVDKEGGGGSWSGGKKVESYYSWVNTKEFVEAETLEKAIDAWRWSVDTDKKFGNVIGIQFEGEKMGDDLTLLSAIAPFVKKGSYIDMRGEEGYCWRWYFDGKSCIEKGGKVVYED